MAGLGGFRHRTHRTVLGFRVVGRDDHDQQGDEETRHAASEELPARDGSRFTGDRIDETKDGARAVERACETARQHRFDRQRKAANREDTRHDEGLVECAHDVRGALRQSGEEGADDRGDDTDRADGEGQHHDLADIRRRGEIDSAEHHRCDERHGVGFEQVSRHAGAVAHVVTDVVGNRGGVARIIFRDTGFDLADHVAADIRTLGEDTAAETGEDRDERSAEAERHERVDDFAFLAFIGQREAERPSQEAVITNDAEQSEADHEHTGDGARFERHLQAFIEADARGFGRADVGANRHEHADEAGKARQHGADDEAGSGFPAERNEEHDSDACADHRDRAILTAEIGVGAFLDRLCDLYHPRIARRRLHD